MNDKKLSRSEELRQAKQECIKRFIRGANHDLNNILTSISGTVSLAKIYLNDDPKGAMDKLDDTEKAISKAKDFISLLHSIGYGIPTLRGEIAPEEIIRSTTTERLISTDIIFDIRIAHDLHQAVLDEGEFKSVLLTLINNASDSAGEHATIDVSAKNVSLTGDEGMPLNAGEYIKITVSDNGQGLDEESAARLFDPYYSTDENKKGLGLAVANGIITEHDGHISFGPRVGGGSEFHIYLPACADPVEVAALKKAESMIGKHRLLMVSIPEEVEAWIEDSLTSAGFALDFSPNAREAGETYNDAVGTEHTFDLVVVDVTGDGRPAKLDFIKALRSINPDINFIILSDAHEDTMVLDYSSFGIAAALVLPCESEDIISLVTKLVE